MGAKIAASERCPDFGPGQRFAYHPGCDWPPLGGARRVEGPAAASTGHTTADQPAAAHRATADEATRSMSDRYVRSVVQYAALAAILLGGMLIDYALYC